MKDLNDLLTITDDSFNELETLESIVELTKKYCLDNEINSNYYDLEFSKKINLSEERNHYINLLTLAIEKITLIKSKCYELEDVASKLH